MGEKMANLLHALAQVNWDVMLPALCGGAFALVCVYVGHRLHRSQAERDRLSDARYHLLVLLRQLQVQVATAVDRCKKNGGEVREAKRRYDDAVLKLALGETTQPLQNVILDTLRRHDNLPELRDVRRALWCPGAGAEKWLAAIREAIAVLEKRVCPRLRAMEDELYAELPENVRQVIEHPETLLGSKRTPQDDPD